MLLVYLVPQSAKIKHLQKNLSDRRVLLLLNVCLVLILNTRGRQNTEAQHLLMKHYFKRWMLKCNHSIRLK